MRHANLQGIFIFTLPLLCSFNGFEIWFGDGSEWLEPWVEGKAAGRGSDVARRRGGRSRLCKASDALTFSRNRCDLRESRGPWVAVP